MVLADLAYAPFDLLDVNRILLPQFVGSSSTTYDDLVQHVKKSILRRSPAFIAKANILGSNTGDSAAQAAGLATFAGSGVASKVGGGVAGLVVYDGIVGSIKSGKLSRGVSEHEAYKFGDIVSILAIRLGLYCADQFRYLTHSFWFSLRQTRGSIRGIKETARAGAMARRTDSNEHHAGDFLVGASRSVSDYASANKSRLGGAAGSTIGMVAGAALLGPVGLVAGSIAGGVALSNALKDKKRTNDDDESNTISSTSQTCIDLIDSSPPISNTHHRPNTNLIHEGPQIQGKQVIQPVDADHQYRNHQQQQQYVYSSQQRSQLQTHHLAEQQRLGQHEQLQQQQQKGYKFGDLTRKIVANGKQKDGRSSNDGYKFCDFTRGLFK
jgi:hypothetical protein